MIFQFNMFNKQLIE